MRTRPSRPSVSNSSCWRHLRQKTAGWWLDGCDSPPSQDRLGRFIVPGGEQEVEVQIHPSCLLLRSCRLPVVLCAGLSMSRVECSPPTLIPKTPAFFHACTGGKGLFPVAQTNVSAGRSSQGLNWCSEWVEEWVEEWVSPPPRSGIHSWQHPAGLADDRLSATFRHHGFLILPLIIS